MGCAKMDMIKFTAAMLDAIEHCASEAKCDLEWRSVCVADMRDAYDLLTRMLARVMALILRLRQKAY